MKKTISQLLAIPLGLFLISATCSPSATTVYSISASPLASFGSVTPPLTYAQPAARTVTITNTGMGAITLDPLPSVPNYTLSTLSTNSLATNGATATFTIRPNAGLLAGTYNPTFVVKGSNGVSVTISPTFTVTSSALTYSISASPLTPFGPAAVGYSALPSQTVTITNTGTGAVTLSDLPSVTNYVLDAALFNKNLAAGATTTFTIRPATGLGVDTYNPTFNVTGSNGVSATISPTFTVTAALTYSITATPATPSFGTQAVGYAPLSPVTVYINNTGTGTVTLNPLPAIANYVLVGPTSTNIPAGSSVTFTIRPTTELGVGSYNPTFSVTGTHGESATINPSFVVREFMGSGLPGAPYIIDSEAKLARMRDLVNLGTGGYSSAYYRQAANLNMSSVSSWEPIGIEAHPFRGIYDGYNYTISSLKINGTGNAGGLFGFVGDMGATIAIRNVRLTDVYISTSVSSSYTNVGGVVGVLTVGTVENCRVLYGSITGVQRVGGIVGYAHSNAIVRNCFVSLESASYVTATHTAGLAGGIVGYNFGGSVLSCYATANVSGVTAGGVVGASMVGVSSSGMMAYCYSTGTIFCTGTSGVGGGVVGNNNSTVHFCVALNKSISGGSGDVRVGRVVGVNWGTLEYNYGRQDMTCTPSYPDIGHSSKDGANIDLSIAKTEAFYRTASYWGGNVWNFTSIWIMGPTDLPTLRNLGTQNPAIVP